jgi:hypothetical protein
MTERTSVIKAVGNYFALKGKVLSYEDYKNAEDAPVRTILIKRALGSWARLINSIGDISKYEGKKPIEISYTLEEIPEPEPVIEPIVPLREIVSARSKNTVKG